VSGWVFLVFMCGCLLHSVILHCLILSKQKESCLVTPFQLYCCHFGPPSILYSQIWPKFLRYMTQFVKCRSRYLPHSAWFMRSSILFPKNAFSDKHNNIIIPSPSIFSEHVKGNQTIFFWPKPYA